MILPEKGRLALVGLLAALMGYAAGSLSQAVPAVP